MKALVYTANSKVELQNLEDPAPKADEVVLRGEPADRSFSCAYLRDGVLIAVDAINAPRDFMQAKTLIADRVVCDPQRLADAETALKDLA